LELLNNENTEDKSLLSNKNDDDLYKSIFQSLKIPTLIVSEDFDVLIANHEFVRLIGCIKDELIGHNILEFFDTETINKFNGILGANFDNPTEPFESFEVVLELANEDFSNFLLNLAPVSGTKNFIISFIEVNQLKKYETMCKFESSCNLIGEKEVEVIWIFDIATNRLKYASPFIEEFRGYTVDEVLNQSLEEMFTPESYERVNDLLIRAVFEGDTSVFAQKHELDQPCKDGSIINTEVSITPITDENGRIKEIMGVIRDITDRKRAEEVLMESEKKYRDLVDNSLVSVFKTNLNGDLLFFNQALVELFDYNSPQQLMNVNVKSWYKKPSDRIRLMEILKKKGSFKDFEVEMVTRNNKKLTVIINSTLEGEIISGMIMDITQLKEVENALKTEKNRLRTLTENAPIGLVLMEGDGTYTYINPKFKELFGYDLEDIPKGKDWFEKAYPDPNYRHNVIKTWVEDYNSFGVGEKRPRTFTVTCKDGSQKEIFFVPVSLDTGEQLMTLEDITQHVKAEKDLKESEEKFRTLAQSAVDAIVIADVNDKIVFCNESLQEIFGYYEGEIIGQQLRLLMPDKSKIKMQIYGQDGISGNLLESYGLRKDGSEFPVELSVNSWISEGEKFTTLIIRDITDRKLIEYKLKMREEMFTQMAENIDEVFWMIDPLMNQIQYVSPAYEKVWGRSVSSLYKNPESWLDSIHPDDREMVARNMFMGSHRIQRRRSNSLEYRIYLPDGSIRWIKSRIFPLINEDKKNYRIVGIALNITRRKKMEKKVEKLENKI
jgi:PAS domain S-box-containing protein